MIACSTIALWDARRSAESIADLAEDVTQREAATSKRRPASDEC